MNHIYNKNRDNRKIYSFFESTGIRLLVSVLFQSSIVGRTVRVDKRNRPDKDGTHRGAYEKNRKKIYATRKTCGICGKPVDFSMKYPHPLSPCIDHIIPINKGGHPSDIANLQLAHWICNREKSDKLTERRDGQKVKAECMSNRELPQSVDWMDYKG